MHFVSHAVLLFDLQNLKVHENRRQIFSATASKDQSNPFARQRPLATASSTSTSNALSASPAPWANGATSNSQLFSSRWFTQVSWFLWGWNEFWLRLIECSWIFLATMIKEDRKFLHMSLENQNIFPGDHFRGLQNARLLKTFTIAPSLPFHLCNHIISSVFWVLGHQNGLLILFQSLWEMQFDSHFL